jgi:hypothetical protein
MYIDSAVFEAQKWFCPCIKRGDKECGMTLRCKATGGLCKFKFCPFVHWVRYGIDETQQVRDREPTDS